MSDGFVERVARDLSKAIHRDVTPGLGHWEEAWKIVEFKSLMLESEMERYIAGLSTRERLVSVGRELLGAWRQANRQYLEHLKEKENGTETIRRSDGESGGSTDGSGHEQPLLL